MKEIKIGLSGGVDVSIYANPEINGQQMAQIRDGLIYDLDVSLYSDYKKYNWQQMLQIKNGLYKQLDVSVFLDSNFK